jgi:hypothetical protein
VCAGLQGHRSQPAPFNMSTRYIAALRPSRILFQPTLLYLLLLCREFPMNCCCWACAFSYTLHNLCVCIFFISRGLSVDKTWPFQSAPGLFLRVSIELSSGTFHLAQSVHFRQLIIIFHSCFKSVYFYQNKKMNI